MTNTTKPGYVLGMPNIDGDALRGHLETLVLSTLKRGQGHGFEILRRLEEAGEGALKLKEGSLYPALYRLESQGMIKGEWVDKASARRGRRNEGGSDSMRRAGSLNGL